MKAVAIILAAGEARKMGYSKALIEHEGGKSFLQSLASTFGKAGCSVMGVIGKEAEAVRDQHPAIHLVENERWQDGQLSSVKAGLEAAFEDGADLVLLHPVDMPALRASTLKTLIKAMGDSVEAIRPEFEGASGFPIILSRGAAERLRDRDSLETQLEVAVRGLQIRRIPVKDPGVVVNINTPETYERLFGSAPKLAPPPKRRGKKTESTGTAVSTGASAPMEASSEGISGS
ncbi:molybdenum cofactor cytidylyltransferase [Archangium gephyra]|uniref:CTP:molybdopterin cytidylyltransferase n=1 Tax=Archangium gephyra TaxID=48 RepID=A0AAC8TKH6_9BACT|nr:NTP transferase domain-containing protein [Archangium gephyra]AKJ08191.1 CTP:molybdopterin cytidylyltransferase [Archangium gephyra]REG29923.1 molybdenum cofactor cytidylyltransferase [Archangium gephyra]